MKVTRLIAAAFFAAASFVASAQTSLNTNQLQTVCTAVKADPTANAARIAGDTVSVLGWLNGAKVPTVLSWRANMTPLELDEAANYTAFDSLTAGKRAAWPLMLGFDRDMRKNKNRNAVADIWGPVTASSVAESILLASTTPATNTQVTLGGTVKTTGTVTATDYNYTGPAAQADASWLVQPANCN
jgi:hypothetical protein